MPFIFVNYIHNFVIFMFELFRQKINVNFNIQIYSFFFLQILHIKLTIS